MKLTLILLLGLTTFTTVQANTISEVVYVESSTDTDKDGELDRIYVSIERPQVERKVSTLFSITPYALGGTEVDMHNVDVDLLPQDESFIKRMTLNNFMANMKKTFKPFTMPQVNTERYAKVRAHSVGTGYSTGCPTVGDMAETLGAKAVIDWLNGRARGFYQDGREALADWANGNVGMTGTSYNGTLPIMVATTGVEGLKAIIPVAAISNWYDYYRSNGLVVNPGGYIGEDADILGYFIVRKGACKKGMELITQTMGRENGDFTPFWQDRDYLPAVKNIKAATFIIHGQSDWNVKQRHAIKLWEALEGVAPRRMFLHRGGHSSTSAHDVPKKVQDWFDHFLEGDENGITEGPQVEVELPDASLITQEEWPYEDSTLQRFYFSPDKSLNLEAGDRSELSITDNGKTEKLETLAENPSLSNEGRMIFLTSPLEEKTLLSGTPRVSLEFAVMNRKAANLTVAIVEYNSEGKGKIITRGWADPQNHSDFTRGEALNPGQKYKMTFELEPKQYLLAEGSRLGILVASTDFEYTLRPRAGTEIQFTLGPDTFIELELSKR